MKRLAKLLALAMLINWLSGCRATPKPRYAVDAPIRKLTLKLSNPLPATGFYRPTPGRKVILRSESEFEKSVFAGYSANDGQRLWATDFAAFYVGQTETAILLYDGANVCWINPQTGAITRKVSAIPSPLRTSYDFNNYLLDGMAFTDNAYLTTKPLYQQIQSAEKTIDETFPIGITAKSWESNEKLWFIPPVKQLVTIEYRPVILGDKVLLINAKQSLDGGHSYQIIDLETGQELLRGTTEGVYFYAGEGVLLELTKTAVSRIEPFTNKVLWKLDCASGTGSRLSVMGRQITLFAPGKDGSKTVTLLAAENGQVLRKLEFTDDSNTAFDASYLLPDGTALLHFSSAVFRASEMEKYDYWVGFDVAAKRALWRTDATPEESAAQTSLFPLLPDKLQLLP